MQRAAALDTAAAVATVAVAAAVVMVPAGLTGTDTRSRVV